MSLLQDEQLEELEGQGRKTQIYKIEFFVTVVASIVISTFVLSRFVPPGTSSVPMVFEAVLFAILLSLLSATWAGRLLPVVFVAACAIFILLKIAGFDPATPATPFDSLWVWIIGVGLFVLILVAYKVVSYQDPSNREAREYEKRMRELGKWQ